MANDDIVDAMVDAAIKAAYASPSSVNSPETRAAYARGIRAMAGIVSACNRVAEQYAEKNKGHELAHTMFKGYSKALRQIIAAADDLIPAGWEE